MKPNVADNKRRDSIMAAAIFSEVFNYTDTKQGIGWRALPSLKPQTFPKRVIDAAIKKGAAKALPTKQKESVKE